MLFIIKTCEGNNKIESSHLEFNRNAKHTFYSMIFAEIYDNCYVLCMSDNGDVYSFGKYIYGSHGHEMRTTIDIPNKINNLTNIKMIDCRKYNSICLDYDGNVFTFGSNYEGQLGIGKNYCELNNAYIPQKIKVPPCKQVYCNYEVSFCLTEDNRLY